MKLLVFLKQVPESNDIRFDHAARTIVRQGVKNVINPYDRRAFSEAIRCKKEKGAEVVAATMGPPQAKEVLFEALQLDADVAVHIEDPALAASDTLVTAHVLASAARKIGFDLILCGQSSTDSETGQVPVQLGELLGIPCAVAVNKIEYEKESIRCYCETDEGSAVLRLPLPAIVSTSERLIKPLKVKEGGDISETKIRKWSLADLKLDANQVGLKGSPTWVAEIQDRSISRTAELWDDLDPEQTARRILAQINNVTGRRTQTQSVPASSMNGDRQYWCWIERYQGTIRSVSLEILSRAATLAATSGGRVFALTLGTGIDRDEARLLSSYGADEIYSAPAPGSHPDEIVSLLCDRIPVLRPYAIFFPATSEGKYLAPRIAARLLLGLTGDCIGLEIDDSGNLARLKPAFGGNIVARIYSRTFPQLATIRPGSLDLLKPRQENDASVTTWTFNANVSHKFQILQRTSDAGAEAAKLDSAKIVICAGMGLGQQNLPLAFRLAEYFHAGVGATRRVVDNGWLARQFQIGLTGKFVAPDIYLGLGVSGRYNHTIGIRKSGNILAINSDPKAEIFQYADIGIVGDCGDVVRQMLKILESESN